MKARNRFDRVGVGQWLSAATLACAALPAVAQAAPELLVDLPAGQACTGFDLRLEARGELPAWRELPIKGGGTARLLQAGRGWAITVTNLNTGASLNLRPNGSVSEVRVMPDGTQHVTSRGHNLLIWFPSDIPAGPWTRLYVGQLTFSIAPDFTFTFGKASGRTVDICAALS